MQYIGYIISGELSQSVKPLRLGRISDLGSNVCHK